jgi:hypothetical protein
LRQRAADALERILLEHAQELGLQPRSDLADLVQQQRAAIGQLEPSATQAIGAGESAFSWPNSSDSSRFSLKRRTVHREHRTIRAVAGRVQRSGDDFLPGAAFAADQDRRVALGHLIDPLLHIAH